MFEGIARVIAGVCQSVEDRHGRKWAWVVFYSFFGGLIILFVSAVLIGLHLCR